MLLIVGYHLVPCRCLYPKLLALQAPLPVSGSTPAGFVSGQDDGCPILNHLYAGIASESVQNTVWACMAWN